MSTDGKWLRQPYRILVADDDDRVGHTLGSRLRSDGYDVEICDNGTDALDRTLAWTPHVAILDHFMPGMKGREVCKKLRAEGARVRIILLTSASRSREKIQGL